MQTPTPATPTFSPRQQAILASLARGTSRTAACHSARVSRRTLYNWIKADPTFAQAVEEAESGAIAQAEDLAYACAMKAADDPRYLRALFFWLKHRAGWTQARADRPPLPPQSHADHAAQATHVVGAQHAAPSPSTLDPASPFGDGIPEENPVIGVPFVPSNEEADEQEATCTDTPVVCPPPEPGSRENPGIGVPSVPSRKRDRMRRPPFKKKKRR